MKSKLSKIALAPDKRRTEEVRYPSELQFYCDLLIRIRQQPVRPVEPGREASFSVIECSRDVATLRQRTASEGLSFLTRSLPSFGKALDRALLGDPNAFVTIPFKKASDGPLPILFGDVLRRVFHSNGTVRSDADGQSVRLLRQLTFSFYKLDVPHDPEVERQIISDFCQVDKDLPLLFYDETQKGPADTEGLERIGTLPGASQGKVPVILSEPQQLCAKVARYIVATILGSLDPRDIVPKHGPGAVSTGEKGPRKAYFTQYIERLERVYPVMEYMKFNLSHVCDTWRHPMSQVEAGTAKVVLVPKDSRGPRLISCEPLSNQWIQQGQMTIMVDRIQAHPLTRGQVNFTDQTINGKLALEGSLTGLLSTLDMKEASDRVSWALIELLFPENWKQALFASRSAFTQLPSGEVIALNKFAPMGSAVCFPVEALCFFALAVGAIYCKQIRLENGSLSFNIADSHVIEKRRVRKIASTIFVYGDDIICRTADCGSIKEYLTGYALRFNESKCCTTGFFRESCGVDAFMGTNVTPTKFRRRMSSSSLSPDSYLSWVEYSNSLFEKGFWLAADYIAGAVQTQVPTPTLYTPDGRAPSRKGGVFFYRPYPGAPQINKRRRNHALQCCEALAWTVVPAKATTTILGWNELLRCETMKPFQATPALTGRSGKNAGVYAVPRSYRLVRGWVPIDSHQ